RPPSRFAASRSRLEGFFLARSASFLRLPDRSQDDGVWLPDFGVTLRVFRLSPSRASRIFGVRFWFSL
ncbi:unnamed protein product, partial [Musa banksii]